MKSFARCMSVFCLMAVWIPVSTVFAGDVRFQIEDIFLKCRHRDGPSMLDDLHNYATAHGLSDKEMSAQLLAMANDSLAAPDNATNRRFAECSICGLALFGGEDELEYVLQVMRKTPDRVIRQVAIRVAIRMASSRWEEVVREIATDDRFDDYDRLGAYEEAFRIGRTGDMNLKHQVEHILSELADMEDVIGNQERLQRWANELKAR